MWKSFQVTIRFCHTTGWSMEDNDRDVCLYKSYNITWSVGEVASSVLWTSLATVCIHSFTSLHFTSLCSCHFSFVKFALLKKLEIWSFSLVSDIFKLFTKSIDDSSKKLPRNGLEMWNVFNDSHSLKKAIPKRFVHVLVYKNESHWRERSIRCCFLLSVVVVFVFTVSDHRYEWHTCQLSVLAVSTESQKYTQKF